MKALVLTAYNEFSYEDMPDPAPGPDDVLVRVRACGICGSDVHGMDGSSGRRVPPIVMGHEAAGIVEQAGANVEGIAEGDRVTFDSTVYCGTCRFCRSGDVNLCDNRRVLGVSCDEYRCHGAFAEYVAVPQRIVYKLPSRVAFEQAAMVEPLSVAFHAVGLARPRLGDTAVVVGAGMIGLLVVQLLKRAGCGRVITVDVLKERLNLSGRLGADDGLVAMGGDVPALIREMTGGGADVAVEAVGIDATVQTAITCLRKGGTLTLVGNVTPEVTLPLQTVVTRQLDLRGSCASSGEYPVCLEMIARADVDVDALISATAPLSDGARWFERLHNKEPGLLKIILVP